MALNDIMKTDLAHVGDLVRTSGGDIGTINGLANLKNALFHRLMTVPGTLVHRPNYGIGITQYQGAPSSYAIQAALAAKITEQFELDPRVASVTGVRIASDDDNPSQFVVAVRVVAKGYTEETMIFTPFRSGT